MNRWAEFRAGTLTPPAVVQRDTGPDGTVLLWIWDGISIIGPVSRKSGLVDDNAVAVEVRDVVRDRPASRDVIDDLRDTIRNLRDTIDQKNARIDTLQTTIDQKNARIDALQTTIDQKNARIDALQTTIDQKNARIDTLLARIAQLENP